LGLVTRTARLDRVVGAADKELVHYSEGEIPHLVSLCFIDFSSFLV
jgi:hypothetical protein